MPITRIRSKATPSSAGSPRWRRPRRTLADHRQRVRQRAPGRRGPDRRAMGAASLASPGRPRWNWTAWDLHPQRRPSPDFRLEIHADAALRNLGQAGAPRHAAPRHVAGLRRPPPPSARRRSRRIGIFENHGDVGTVLHPGSVSFDAVDAELHPRRQRREHVVHAGRLPLRLEEGCRRPRAGGRHRLRRRRPGTASQGVPDDPPGPGRRLGLRRRRAARRRPDVAAIPRGPRGAPPTRCRPTSRRRGGCASRSGASTC